MFRKQPRFFLWVVGRSVVLLLDVQLTPPGWELPVNTADYMETKQTVCRFYSLLHLPPPGAKSVCVCVSSFCGHPQRSSDGSLSQEEESGPTFGKVSELQEVVDRQTADLGQMKERMGAMVSRITELEEDLDTARKDLIKSEDMNTRLQRDLREVGRAEPAPPCSQRMTSQHFSVSSSTNGSETVAVETAS